ncbi:hypothetical protein G443_002963 [Actinoalloteichus cyanogriseus DSM 43889]|uniref:Secreted protein n=2 Tax=Actinoalloteichus cyanogriseus TaxID=2893586 RepID=A0ABT1JJK9_ACTCY|nr:hypothetical protein [Actinoalloteichus caeruleus DSM 43889]
MSMMSGTVIGIMVSWWVLTLVCPLARYVRRSRRRRRVVDRVRWELRAFRRGAVSPRGGASDVEVEGEREFGRRSAA